MNIKTGNFFMRIAAIALSIAVACPYAYAASIGKVTYVEGRVDVTRPGSDMATPLREGDGISIGDAVRAKANSKTEITFNDKSTLRVAQNSKIVVKDYVLDSGNNRKTADIMLERGKARTIISKMADKAEFRISTPNAMGMVRGSDVYASYQAGSSSMLVAEGKLFITNPLYPNEELVVPAGNSVMVPSDEKPNGIRPYMDFEKKLQEQETSIPTSVVRSVNATTLKGVFTNISGDVRVTSKGSESSHEASVNEILGEGDKVETGNDGIAEISFENGNGMNLKENTNIKIIKLIQDPKTGQYENKFEASMGNVRARIEKLKETNSTFEVKTPTAVCGARGTLMYVQVTPGNTRVFFEGGVGNLHSLISSLQTAVEAGYSASADDNGNITEPYIPDSGERFDWTEGWNAGNGTEGYSSPEGVGVYLDGGNIAGGTNIPPTENQLQEFFNDPLFSIDETIPLAEEETLPTDHNFSANISGLDQTPGMEGYLDSDDFPDGESMAIISTGSIQNTGGTPFTWSTGQSGFYSNGAGNTRMTSDGGAFYGVSGGIGHDSLIEGAGYVIYIDPNGEAGIASGDIFGAFSDSNSVYALGGEFDSIFSAGNIGVNASQLYDSIVFSDNFTSDGLNGGHPGGDAFRIQGGISSGSTQFISGQNWGTYSLNLSSDSNKYKKVIESKIWSAIISGSGLFGSDKSVGVMGGDVYGISEVTEISDGIERGTWSAMGVGMWSERDSYDGDQSTEGIYYGLMGGMWIDGRMIGKMIGLYVQPGDVEPEIGTISVDMDNSAGYFFGKSNEWPKSINITYFDGQRLDVPGYDLSAWGISIVGNVTNTDPSQKMSVFHIDLEGATSSGDGSEGYWWGLSTGSHSKASGIADGNMVGLTWDDGNVGIFFGELLGAVTGDTQWEAYALGEWKSMGTSGTSALNYSIILGSASGSFSNGGAMSANIRGYSVGFMDRKDWGIWIADFYGQCDANPSSGFSLAIAAKSDSSDGYIIGTMNGTTKKDGATEGYLIKSKFNGIWLESTGGGMFTAGTMEGVGNGYIDVAEGNGTWNAGTVGKWVEVTDLLTADKLGFDAVTLNKFVSVPITEVYSNMLSGFSGGMSAVANVSLYNNDFARIWTMLINGNYTSTPGSGWNLTVGGGSDSLNLQNGAWNANGTWTADVGQVDGIPSTVGGNIITGQAGGTYGDGSFSGVGAGTWTAPVNS